MAAWNGTWLGLWLEAATLKEFRAALELATDEELQGLTELLFRPKFNPLDYLRMPDPLDVGSQERDRWLDTLEERFRFLAADGLTVLRQQTDRLTYRQILIQVCRYLKIPHSPSFSTVDLEAEIFLHLLNRVWQRLPQQDRNALNQRVRGSLTQSQQAPALPLALERDPLGLAFKGGSALAVSSVLRPWLLQQIARQFALHFATYQVTRQALASGGAAAAQFQGYTTLRLAQRGMALSAARYGAVRTVFAVLGPVLWAWFLTDLGWRAIATNYSRVIPTIFTLAQIRLTRSECFEVAYS